MDEAAIGQVMLKNFLSFIHYFRPAGPAVTLKALILTLLGFRAIFSVFIKK